jgi:hypothetical protein
MNAQRAVLTIALLLTGCADDKAVFVGVGDEPDASTMEMNEPAPGCDMVQVDGEMAIELEQDFTARFAIGEPYEKTLMLFGGEEVEEENTFSNAYIFGLDKEDAVRLAEMYPDFYLCSSPGGMAASMYIVPYDLVPASCEVYDALTRALRVFRRNAATGGDRTSLRIEGAPLELISVTANATGEDVTAEVAEQDFHLVTEVEQLTGESVLSFGTEN